jgi:hypothetical protein
VDEITLGNLVRISFALDVASTPTDPDSLALTAWSDWSATLGPYEWTSAVPGTVIEQDSTGRFHADLTPLSAGTWSYRWVGLDSNDEMLGAADGQFRVVTAQNRLLTVADFKALHKTNLSDAAIETYLDAARKDLDLRYGPLGVDIVQEFRPKRPYPNLLSLRYPVATVGSVVQRVWGTDTTLDPTDYRLSGDGLHLSRLSAGAVNPSFKWAGVTTITYQQRDDSVARKRIQAQLVTLDARFEGRQSHSTGDEGESFGDYAVERQAILASLRPKVLTIR